MSAVEIIKSKVNVSVTWEEEFKFNLCLSKRHKRYKPRVVAAVNADSLHYDAGLKSNIFPQTYIKKKGPIMTLI